MILDGIIAAFHQPLFQLPNFRAPKFTPEAILIILPVILVIANGAHRPSARHQQGGRA